MKKLTKKNILKVILSCIICFFAIFSSPDYANASDYKYKVLDPKYNPEAEQLINGTLPPERTMYVEKKEGFDFATFLAIFALVTFPFGIIYIAVRTFKEVMQEPLEEKEKKHEEQTIGNIRIVQDVEQEDNNQKTDNESPNVDDSLRTSPYQQAKKKEITNKLVNKYFDSAESVQQVQTPKVVYTSPLSSNKGFCLVLYNQKYSLIGYINQEIFLLNQFDNVKTKEIRARLAETKKSGERYIVKLDGYNAIVEVSADKMDIIANL